MAIKWHGIDKVLKNLEKEKVKITKTLIRNLATVAIRVKKKSQSDIPIDIGNLRASAYAVVGGGGVTPKEVGANFVGFSDFFTAVSSSSTGLASELSQQHIRIINEKKKQQQNPFAIIGHTVFYATKIHESPTAFLGKRIRGRTRFLISSLNEEQPGMLKTLTKGI